MTRAPGLGRLLGRALRVSLATRAAYRGDLVLSLLVTLLLEAITPMVTLLVYGAGARFPGWSMAEALLVQAIFMLARGLAQAAFFGMVWTVFEQVQEGTFELTLLKPRSPLLLTLMRSLNVQGLGQVAGGAALLAWAAARLPAPGPAQVLSFLALEAVSVAVLFAVALFMTGSLFVWVGNARVIELSDGVLLFAQYPASIYGRGFRLLLATALPVSVIAFMPAAALLGRPDPLTAIAAASALVFLGAAVVFWRVMLRRYAGGGG